MTKEQIKQTVKIVDVLKQHGISVDRNGFCRCIFHDDSRGSMKIYPNNSFYCFGCGAGGDVLKVYMQLQNCDFRTAFLALGGEYRRLSPDEYRRQKAERERQKAEREVEKRRLQDERRLNGKLIDLYRRALKTMMPLSEGWAMIYDALRRETYRCGELN